MILSPESLTVRVEGVSGPILRSMHSRCMISGLTFITTVFPTEFCLLVAGFGIFSILNI